MIFDFGGVLAPFTDREERRQWEEREARVALTRERGVQTLRVSLGEEHGAARCLLARHGFRQVASLTGHLRRPDGAPRDVLSTRGRRRLRHRGRPASPLCGPSIGEQSR